MKTGQRHCWLGFSPWLRVVEGSCSVCRSKSQAGGVMDEDRSATLLAGALSLVEGG